MSNDKSSSLVGHAKDWKSAVQKIGFTVVGDGGSKPTGDIVILHGLQGHPWKTWACKRNQVEAQESSAPDKFRLRLPVRHKKGVKNDASISTLAPDDLSKTDLVTYWPGELLPRKFPTQRILTYGYDSHISHFFHGAAVQGNIWTIARDFLQELAALRKGDPKRPLLFICHSLGGLVVKSALIRAWQSSQPSDRDLRLIYESTYAIAFFGTPHRGSAYSPIGLRVSHLVRALGFDTNDATLRDLKTNSTDMEELRERFGAVLQENRIYITTLQEGHGLTRGGPLKAKIVDVESSGIDHPFERKFTILANHMDMCRFSSAEDHGFTLLCNEVERHIERLAEAQNRLQKKCLESLYISDMYVREQQIDHAHERTLGWLLDPEPKGPGLVEWLQCDGGVFWVQGKPGSGKSTAMKHLYKMPETMVNLRRRRSGAWKIIGLFFTDRGDPKQRSWKYMLHAMLHGLLVFKPSLLSLVVPYGLQDEDSNGGALTFKWTVANLKDALLQCKTQHEVQLNACFLLDALDEHEGDHQAMGNFLHLLSDDDRASSPSTRIKICVSSRPLNQLKDLFGQDAGLKMQEWTKSDIQAYVKSRLSHSKRAKEILEGPQHQNTSQLLSKIIHRADGVFLWVRLVLDEVLKGISMGESMASLNKHIDDLPDDLHDFFAHMLRKVDKEYHLECFIILETVLRARQPLTVAQVAMCVEANLPGDHEKLLKSKPTIRLDMEPNSRDVERRIMAFSGGLLEARPPVLRLHFDLPDLPKKSDNESDLDDHHTNTTNPAGDHKEFSSGMSNETSAPISDWIVQPLHQTVKEFLREPDVLDFLELSRRGVLQSQRKMINGHMFILKACQYWVRMPPEKTLRKFVVAEVLHHGTRVEQTLGSCPTDVLDDLNTHLTRQSPKHECWPEEYEEDTIFCRRNWLPEGSRYSFLAYAVTANMSRYVRATLNDRPTSTLLLQRRTGLPLLFYALCCPGHGSDARLRPDMVDILLQNECQARDCVDNLYHGEPIDSLAFAVQMTDGHDWSDIGGPFTDIHRMLLCHKTNPNARISMEVDTQYLRVGFNGDDSIASIKRIIKPWVTIAQFFAKAGLEYERLFILLEDLAKAGADLNARSSKNRTLIEMLMLDESFFAPLEFWIWLLEHGARITHNMVDSLYGEQYEMHPLRESACRKREFYEWRAAEAVSAQNPEWSTGRLAAFRWMRSASDVVLRKVGT